MKLLEKLFGPKKTLGELMLENKKYQEEKLRKWSEKQAVEQYWKFLERTNKYIKKYHQDNLIFPKSDYYCLVNNEALFADLKAVLARENLEVSIDGGVFLGEIQVKPSKELMK